MMQNFWSFFTRNKRTNAKDAPPTHTPPSLPQEGREHQANQIIPTPYLDGILIKAPKNEQGDLSAVSTIIELMQSHCVDSKNNLLVAERERNWIAAVRLKQPENVVVFFCTRQFSTSAEYFSLLQLIKLDKQLTYARTIFAEAGAILASYHTTEFDDESGQTQVNSQSGALFLNIVRTAMANQGVTDIHLEIKQKGVIRHRIDGRVVGETASYPASALISVCGYAYTQLASSNSRSSSVFSRFAPQSCLIELNLDGLPVRLRYQHTPLDNNGLKCVLRILPVQKRDKTAGLLLLSDLGYTDSQIHTIKLATRTTLGAFVLSGVTGSGKSTTIKSILETDSNRDELVTYTIEDPVEYTIEGVAQIPIQRSHAGRMGGEQVKGTTFAEVIVALLRMDPDRIVPGEIRERETAKAVETAVLTGHQVLTTVHASSALSIIDRLSSEEIGLSRQVLSLEGFLSGLLYQRLMPKNCQHCAIPSTQLLPVALLNLIEKKYHIDPKTFMSRNISGCSHCNAGIRGQKVAAEIILPSISLDFLHAIRQGNDVAAREIWLSSRVAGFDHADMNGKTAMEHAIYDMTRGIIDPLIVEESFLPFEIAAVWK